MLSAPTALAGKIEIHEMTMLDGVTMMRPIDTGLAIPAGETITLAPVGYHRSIEEAYFRCAAAVLAQDAMPESAAIARALRHYVSAVRSRLAKAYAAESDVQSPIEFADGALAVIQGAAALARIEKKPERAVEIVEIWLDGWTPLIPGKQRR